MNDELVRRLGLIVTLLPLLAVQCQAEEPTTARTDTVWIDASQGEPLHYDEMLKDLATADVVYLGERHTLQRHHAIQAKIVADYLGVKPLPADSSSPADNPNTLR